MCIGQWQGPTKAESEKTKCEDAMYENGSLLAFIGGASAEKGASAFRLHSTYFKLHAFASGLAENRDTDSTKTFIVHKHTHTRAICVEL